MVSSSPSSSAAAQQQNGVPRCINISNNIDPFDCRKFEKEVQSTKRGAMHAAGLQIISRFLGYCALTWATVALLGGFVSVLRHLDFYLVAALLLFEGIRLFIVQIFNKLLSRSLFREPPRPEEFRFIDRQPSKSRRLDLLGQSLGSLLAAASLFSSLARLIVSSFTHHHLDSVHSTSVQYNLRPSLLLFYITVILNSSFALLSACLHVYHRQRCHATYVPFTLGTFLAGCVPRSSAQHSEYNQDSLKCFHDEVFKTAMGVGLPEADQLDIMDFAFRKISSDYKRNIRPQLVMEINRDLIRYLFYNQQGIAMACQYLKAGDVWQKQVAANLPGLWAQEKKIERQVGLFWALRERIHEAGKDAESALDSMRSLARAWAARTKPPSPYPFLIEDPGAGSNVVDTLVQLLLKPIRPNLLFQVRAFEACCRNAEVVEHLYKTELELHHGQGRDLIDPERVSRHLQGLVMHTERAVDDGSKLQMLCRKLQSVVREGEDVRAASKIYAANALVLLLCYGRSALDWLSEETKAELKAMVEDCIRPGAEASIHTHKGSAAGLPYFWPQDVMVVESLRRRLGLDPYPLWSQTRLIQPNCRDRSGPHSPNNALVNHARQMDWPSLGHPPNPRLPF